MNPFVKAVALVRTCKTKLVVPATSCEVEPADVNINSTTLPSVDRWETSAPIVPVVNIPELANDAF